MPSLPPSIDGLGDFCRQLWLNCPGGAQAAAGAHRSISWHFLVAAGPSESQRLWPEVTISQFERSRLGLLSALGSAKATTILVQYVGYGYDRDGKPFWLPEALKDWLSLHHGVRLITMFHETWASGMPWQRSFWQCGQQRHCAGQLLALSQEAITSNRATLQDLQSLGTTKEIKVIPLGASFVITETGILNWRQALIYGKQGSRLRSIKLHANVIKNAAKLRLLDSILLAGESADHMPDPGKKLLDSWNLPLKIRTCFNFPSSHLPADLLNCGLSFMHTQSTCLLKSTAFQLAAQTGQVPVVRQELDPGEPLQSGSHYLGYRAGQTDSLLAALSATKTLTNISSQLLSLGHTIFSWREIGKAWADVIVAKS